MPGAHATLSPSAAKRWCNCPPSARLNQKYIERFGDATSEFAAEGTQAHALAELKLRKELGEINEFSFKAQVEQLGKFPAEMDRYTDVYVDAVLEEYYALKRVDPETQLFVEQKLSMEQWIPQCFGTSDAVVLASNSVCVIDLKYGKGVPIDAVGNYQARIYALGVIEAFGAIYDFENIKTVICQPRLDSKTEEILTRTDLLKWADEVIKPAAELAFKGLGEFQIGEHCRFCNVRPLCRTRINYLLDLAAQGFDSPDIVGDDILAEMLPYLDDIADYIKDVKAYALNRAKQGDKIKGFKLIRGRRPGRAWKDEDEVLDQLSRAGYTEDQYAQPAKLKSPSEMEKTIGKKAFEAILGKLITQGEGALTLVPEDDPREEYNAIETAFADLND